MNSRSQSHFRVGNLKNGNIRKELGANCVKENAREIRLPWYVMRMENFNKVKRVMLGARQMTSREIKNKMDRQDQEQSCAYSRYFNPAI